MEQERKTPQSVIDAVARYKKKHHRGITISLNKENKKHILDKLDSVPNKTEYICRLIDEDMKNG